MKKRTKKDIVEEAAPDLLGDKSEMVKTNFVEFPVSTEVYKKLSAWFDAGDRKELIIGGAGKNKIIIINPKEQYLYMARGYKDN
jgi:hypothetical protein